MKLVVVSVAVLLMCGSAMGLPITLEWYNDVTDTGFSGTDGVITNNTGTALALGPDPTTAPFAQLIYAGADGVADLAFNTGNGVTDDDQVIAVAWLTDGASYAGALWGSAFNYPSLDDGVNVGDVLFVRVWESAAAFYDGTVNSTVDGTLGSYYGDSQTYTVTAAGNQFFNAGGWQTSLQSVPEPSTLALCALAVGAVGLVKRRKK